MSDLKLIRTLSKTLLDTELYEACCILAEAYNMRVENQTKIMKALLNPGDRVMWPVAGDKDAYGEVKKVKRRKAIVYEISTDSAGIQRIGRQIDIPLGMLTKVR